MVVTTEILRKRAAAARALFKRNRLDAILFFKPASVRYLSSLEATSAAVLLTRRSRLLFTDFRYLEEARVHARGFRIKAVKGRLPLALGGVLSKSGIRRLGFESSGISHAFYRLVKRGLGKGVALVPLAGDVDCMRAVKDPGEVRLLRKAARIAESALDCFCKIVREGMTEREVAAILDAHMRIEGSERASFDTIVASGRRAAMPHAKASGRKIRRGEPILVDLGAVVGGYHSDLTRTFFLSRIPPGCRAVYERVIEAQIAAIASLIEGVQATEVDGIARKIIDKAPKVGDFGHGLGHGVGMEVHEAPVLSPSSKDVLRSGMVVTVEPGIYRRGSFGIRVEDMVLVTKTGARLLTDFPKNIEEVVI